VVADNHPTGGAVNDCSSIVRTVIAEVLPGVGFETTATVDARQGFVVDLLPGEGWPILATARGMVTELARHPADQGFGMCLTPSAIVSAPVVPTGVTMLGDDVWVTTREPFTLSTLTSFEASSGPDHAVTALTMFHDTPAGLACASCHAEGGDDAHTWNFEGIGARRTQSLGGMVVSETEPFHWNGELPTFEHLLADVAVGRMGLDPAPHDDVVELLEFLDLLPAAPPAGPPSDPDLVAKGAILFADEALACTECHSGWRYTNGESADVGTGGTFQVPSLLGVGARLPVMHDGCAQTLRQRFDDPVCGGVSHGDTASLTSEQIDALVAFLASL
jgi:hypothetical protein